MLLVCYCFAETKALDLYDFFESRACHTEKLDLDFGAISYSYMFSEDSSNIVGKALFYILENDKVVPLLIFDKDQIFNSAELLFHGSIATQKFYGWNIRINKNNGSVSTDFYTNDGRNVTDGPSFILNKNTMKYTRYVIDPAEY